MSTRQLILASASPRRRALLVQLGVSYLSDPADIDETRRGGETAPDYVARIACEKARHVATRHPGDKFVVLAADTIVTIDEEVLGKPRDHCHGMAMLESLSGRAHTVMTAVCVCRKGEFFSELVSTKVEFMALTRSQCAAYLATDEPWDKAGGYAIQGLGGVFVRSIYGSYSNVVGLPLGETWAMLRAQGINTALESGCE